MLDKKKHHFSQLSVIFGAIVVLVLLSNWGYYSGVETGMSMMGDSMGSMMRTMHGEEITIYDLISQQNRIEATTVQENHHESIDKFLAISFDVSTALMMVLLPFIVAGTVFLSIMWFK